MNESGFDWLKQDLLRPKDVSQERLRPGAASELVLPYFSLDPTQMGEREFAMHAQLLTSVALEQQASFGRQGETSGKRRKGLFRRKRLERGEVLNKVISEQFSGMADTVLQSFVSPVQLVEVRDHPDRVVGISLEKSSSSSVKSPDLSLVVLFPDQANDSFGGNAPVRIDQSYRRKFTGNTQDVDEVVEHMVHALLGKAAELSDHGFEKLG